MKPLLPQQQALLQDKLTVLRRLQEGLAWSLSHLPALDVNCQAEPEVSERISAIVDRFCKLQDQLASALRQAHTIRCGKCLLWERACTRQQSTPIASKLAPTEKQKRSAASALVRSSYPLLVSASSRFAEVCAQRALLPAS